jgi:O-antigen ligase
VYPRFQPPAINGAALFAHDDYAQLLFEGGIFAVLLVAAFAVLALKRAATLVRAARQQKRLRREEMAAAICGLGLLGFLVHCTVEFNMHIPANAIVAALLAGVYLRPLAPPSREAADD